MEGKKIYKTILFMTLMVSMILGSHIAAQAAAKTPKYSISVNKSVYTLKKGKTVKLKATVNKAAKKKKTVWSSSNKKVATVSSNGKVTAKKNGKTRITARVQGTKTKASCMIYVGTPIKSVQLGQKTVSLQTGGNFQIKTTIKPQKAAVKKVIYKSSNSKVATVSQKGVIRAVAEGKAKITATAADGSNKKASCTVTVTAADTGKDPSDPNKEPEETDKKPGNSKLLVAYFSWSGTSERIAKTIIEQTGADEFRIERETPYSTDYTETAYGDAKTEAEQNARPPIKAPLSSVAQYEKIILCYPIWWHTAPMTVGTFLERYDLSGKQIYPISQSASMDRSQFEQSVAFIRECAKGAVVDDGLFTKDTASILAYVENTVLQPPKNEQEPEPPSGDSSVPGGDSTEILAESVTFDFDQINLKSEEEIQLTATVLPADAVNRELRWESSNPEAATVSEHGIVKSVSAGTAVIRAAASNGVYAECTVTVEAAEADVTPEEPDKNPEEPDVEPEEPDKNPGESDPEPERGKLLVAYFSWSGTSERIARNIIEQTGADEFRIERETPYSTDYTETAYGDAKTEADENARPPIKDPLDSVEQYDKIILCYPIWWHTAPMTVGTFLERYDLSGKQIYPVSQSASMDRSQYEQSVAFVRECAKGAFVDNGIFSKDNAAIREYVENTVLPEAEASGDTVLTADADPVHSQTLYLWEEGNVPAVTNYTVNNGSYADDPDFRPYVVTFPVPEGTSVKGAALVCAGGAFQFRSDQMEGTPVAQELARRGYQSFVVNYRLRPYTQEEGALDLARAVRFVRKHADVYGFDEKNIAVMGFSAGGILAGEMLLNFDGTVNGTALDNRYIPDELDLISADAAADGMIYSFYGRLSVASADVEKFRASDLPPTYFAYGTEDPFVSQFEKCIAALWEADVTVETNVLEGRPHGFGYREGWISDYDRFLTEVFQAARSGTNSSDLEIGQGI